MTTHEALWWMLSPGWWTSVVCFIVACVHANLDGQVDARHFDRNDSPRQTGWPNIHIDFVWRRSCLWMVVAFAAGLPTALACMLVFPFMHDGSYYFTRHLIDVRLYGMAWKSEPSGTSTARFDFSYRTRCLLAAAGIIIVLAVVFVTINFPNLRR